MLQGTYEKEIKFIVTPAEGRKSRANEGQARPCMSLNEWDGSRE